mgnify:CR=1 FL=1
MLVEKSNIVSALEHLDSQTKLAIDTETYGLRWHHRLFSIEVASADRQYHFDRRVLGEEFDKIKLLFAKERTYYFQNAKFDLRMLRHEGIELKGRIIDLEVLVRLAKNDVMSTKLEATAKRYGMEKQDMVMEYIKEHKLYTKATSPYWDKVIEDLHFDRVPIELIAEYGAHDARITYDLCEKVMAEIDERSMPVLENEVALTPICLDMEWDGCLIDRDYTLATLEQEKRLILEAKHQFHLATGQLYDGSKGQLLEVFTKAGEFIPSTAKGNPSLNADALEGFTSPIAKVIQNIRFYEKRSSTYYSSFLDLGDYQGRLHADIRQAGTTTGRFSYRDPNLQQLSKEDDEEDFQRDNLIRRCFIPEPGHTLVSCDYAAQELRLMYAYANQWNMIDAINMGLDPHTSTSELIGSSRNIAKRYAFMLLYGSGIPKIAKTLGITEDQARLYYTRFTTRLPMVMALLNQIKHTAVSRGHVYNWMGRKLHLPGGIRANAYAVPNHLIQSSGADICKKAMVEVAPLLHKSGAKLHTQIHDALVFQWPTENLDQIEEIKQTMEGVWPVKNGMGMAVDVKYSNKSLAEKDMEKWQPTKKS